MSKCKQLYCDRPVEKVTKNYYGYSQSYNLKTCAVHKKTDNVAVGTRKILSTGYVNVKTEGGWRIEHTMIMEKILGRKLLPGESVHHKNGIKHDNREDNLELWIGNIRYAQRAIDIKCPNCRVSYWEAVKQA